MRKGILAWLEEETFELFGQRPRNLLVMAEASMTVKEQQWVHGKMPGAPGAVSPFQRPQLFECIPGSYFGQWLNLTRATRCLLGLRSCSLVRASLCVIL